MSLPAKMQFFLILFQQQRYIEFLVYLKTALKTFGKNKKNYSFLVNIYEVAIVFGKSSIQRYSLKKCKE